MASEITCSLKQIKQCRQMAPLCWHCWDGLGWQLIGGVNISNSSPEYLQPERVISGSCNYPPGYIFSELTSGLGLSCLGFPFQSGLPEELAFHSLPWFPVNCQLSIPPSHFHHLCRPGTRVTQCMTTDMFM